MQSDSGVVSKPVKAAKKPKDVKKRKRADTEEEDEEAIDSEMKDFIVPDEEADKGVVGDVEDDDDPRALTAYAASIAKSADFDKMGTVVNDQGLRRSARANKGVPPKVYIDEDYAALMLEGADPEDVFRDSEEDDDDSTAAGKRRVRDLEESEDGDEDEDDGGPDEPDEDDDFEPDDEDDNSTEEDDESTSEEDD
jgi:hypothetical protein